MLRQPAVAGAFYPGDSEILKNTIEKCFLDDFGVGEWFRMQVINILVQ